MSVPGHQNQRRMPNWKIISETVKREKYGDSVDIHRLNDSWFIYQHSFQ